MVLLKEVKDVKSTVYEVLCVLSPRSTHEIVRLKIFDEHTKAK